MADNTTLNTGTGGDVIASDDITGVKYQRVKITLGADGVNDGDVSSSNALPVSLASVPSHAVTNAGTFVVQENGSALTSLQLLDDAVTTTASAITTKGIAASGTDGTNARILKTDTNGELQVDVLTLPTIPSGTNHIGKFTISDNTNDLVVDTTHNDAESNTENHLDVAAKLMGYNGTTWDRLRTDTTNGLDVDVTRLPSLPAGSNSIGILGANSGVDIGDVTINNSTGASAVNIQDGGNSITVDAPIGTPVNVQIGNATLAAGVIDETGASAVDALAVGGGTAHDAVDSGNPIKMGLRAISHGSNPSAVASADRTHWYSNIAGIPFVIGGHPNIQTAEYYTTGAQTDDNIMPAIAAGTIYVVTMIQVTASNANTVNTSVRIGFGATAVPTQGASGADAVTQVVLSHGGIAPGSGMIIGNGGGIIGIGGDGVELRITNTAPTTGDLRVVVTYYTIAS
jgi:hypothetical protein